jgi:ribonuclease BN (tRNA processing enzyme)
MMGSKITFKELKEEEFTIGSLTIQVHYMNHTSLTLGFRISGDGVVFCYCTDTEPHSLLRESNNNHSDNPQNFVHTGDKKLVDFVRNADLLIIDSQYTEEEYQGKKGWGHSPVEYVADVALLGGVKQLALFHHDPEHPDSLLDSFEHFCRERIASFNKSIKVHIASEGLEIAL